MKANQFFEWLYEPIKDEYPDYKVLLCEKEGGKDAKGLRNGTLVSPFSSDEVEKAINDSLKRNANLYFSCAVAMEPSIGEKIAKFGKPPVKYEKTDITGSCFLWAEIDDKDRIVSEEEIAEWKKYELGPSIIIRSGGGYHLYWLLSEFVTDRKAVELANKWLAERFDGDSCFDVNRILRVVDTKNFKDLSNPKDVKVIWYAHDRGGAPIRRKFEQFPRAEDTSVEVLTRGEVEKIILNDSFLEDKRFGENRWLIDRMFEHLEPNNGQGGRSKRDFLVAQKMGKLGFTEQEIFSCLTHPHWPIGDKGRDNIKYARTTAAKAAAAQDNFEKALEMLEKAMGNTMTEEYEAPVRNDLGQGIDSVALSRKVKEIFRRVLQAGGEMRQDKGAPKFGAIFGEEVAKAVVDAGYRYVYDPEYNQAFITDRRGKVWEAAKGSANFEDFVSGVSGFGSNQEEFRFIAAGIITYIKRKGEQIKIGRWVHYDHEKAKYYILADNDTGVMYIINQDGTFSTDWNGAGDVFLRPRTQASFPLKITEGVSPTEAVNCLEDIFTKYIAGPATTKRFITSMLVALTMCYGSNRIGTLPILHLTGPAGGGKSSTIGCMTSYLFGYAQVLLYTTASAYRTAPNEVFMAHDDNEDISSEMEKFFLLCSTKATRTMCDVGSQVDVVTQKAHLVNGITSINQLKTPALRRRTFVIEIDKDKFPSEEELTEDDAMNIAEKRDFIWSGMIPIFSKMIQNFQDGTYRELSRKVYKYIEEGTFKGLASFVSLMVLVEEELAKHAGRPFDQDVTIQEFVSAAGLDDKEEILGRDPMVICLESYFEKLFATHVSDIDLSELGGEFDSISLTNPGLRGINPLLTSEEENATITEILGCKVRGVRASAAGWVTIFSEDTREFAKTINSPTSLGKQFSRVEKKLDFPFYIVQKRKAGKKIWSVFQKIE